VKGSTLIGIAMVIGFILASKKVPDGILKTSKGVNNPGNIKNFGGTPFKGETTKEGESWKSFSSPAYGYRAIIVLLRNYYKKGVKTIAEIAGIISRYAPGSENPTLNYIQYVSKAAGIDPNADVGEIIHSDQVKKIVAAITQFEQGKKFAVNQSHITEALNLA